MESNSPSGSLHSNFIGAMPSTSTASPEVHVISIGDSSLSSPVIKKTKKEIVNSASIFSVVKP